MVQLEAVDEKKKNSMISLGIEIATFFFLLERPNLFAVCNNTFSK
jgi:hypothetical protein